MSVNSIIEYLLTFRFLKDGFMDDHPPSSRRERRIAARRTLILEAAARLFAEKGFHRTTTKDIAEAADVSEGTLYNYFENKDEMLMGIMTLLVDAQRVDLRLSDGLPVEARRFLMAMLQSQREMVEQKGAMLQSVLSEILVNPDLRQRYYEELTLPVLGILTGHLQARRLMGQISPVDPALVARILVGLTTGLFILEVLGDPKVTAGWEELSEAISSVLFDGVANRKDDHDPEEPVSP
jgi:AcrR family transcriptional regulator